MGKPAYQEQSQPQSAGQKNSETSGDGAVSKAPPGMGADSDKALTASQSHQEQQQMILLASKLPEAMRDGLTQAMEAVEDPEVDRDESTLSKLFELAIDAVIAGTAETAAVVAVEAIAEHAKEGIVETVKAMFENSAKAVMGKKAEVDTKELRKEFKRIANARRVDYVGTLVSRWPAIAGAIESMGGPAAAAMIDALNSIDGEMLINRFELQYMTSWLNFLARAKHGPRGEGKEGEDNKGKDGEGNKGKESHKGAKEGAATGSENISGDSIPMFQGDGSFQRPPQLYGVLEVNLNPGEKSGYVMLDNVGKEVRQELRRLGHPAAFPNLMIGDLHMNMIVREGPWGTVKTELIVGADGQIQNVKNPTPHMLDMVHRANHLAVSNIRPDMEDSGHNK